MPANKPATTYTCRAPVAFRLIIERKTLAYRGKVIIAKVLISASYRYKAVFYNEGCFIQIRRGGTKLLSVEDDRLIENQEAVLMKCGNYFLDFVAEIAGATIEVLAMHLYPDILRQIYSTELPVPGRFWKTP